MWEIDFLTSLLSLTTPHVHTTMNIPSREKRHMLEALAEATKALNIGEVPVGCVIVDTITDKVVSRGGNRTNLTCNATRHAEFEALDNILLNENSTVNLSACELFVTVEPCIMCADALARVGISKVYFGCHNLKFGGNGSIMSLHAKGAPVPACAHPYSSCAGLLKDEAIALLRQFYEMGNPHAPNPQRAVVVKKSSSSSSSSSSTEGTFR